MSARRLATLTLAALALAAPSSALAQGAGDEQYTDPFGTQQGDSGSGGGSSPSSGGSDQAPAPASAPAPAPSGASAPTSSAAAPESASLPRTGADATLVALLGAGLILTGVGLRMRVRVD